MRDPERIDLVLTELAGYWKSNPDMRLGQILVILAQPSTACPDVFYMEDDLLLDRLNVLKKI